MKHRVTTGAGVVIAADKTQGHPGRIMARGYGLWIQTEEATTSDLVLDLLPREPAVAAIAAQLLGGQDRLVRAEGRPIEDVAVRIPFPSNTVSATLSSNVGTVLLHAESRELCMPSYW